MKKVTCLIGSVLMTVLTTSLASALDKIDGKVSSDISRHGKAKVLIVMREPKLGETRSAAAGFPSSYLQDTLQGECSNVSQLGNLPVALAEITAAGLDKLKGNPNVAAVFNDTPMSLELPAVETHARALDLVDVIPAWNGGYKGQNQVIAILDTGANYSHPYLNGKLKAEACFSTPRSDVYKLSSLCPAGTDVSTVQGAGLPCDGAIKGCDHGTHVAGIAAGRQTAAGGTTLSGIAPEAGLISIKIFTLLQDASVCGEESAPCIRTFPSDQLRALNYVNDTLSGQFPIAAVNMSVGGGRFERPCDAESPLTTIIDLLRKKGIATVIAAGNDRYFNAISEPACIEKAVSVGATFPDKPVLDISYSDISPEVHFVAPGTSITSSLLSGFGDKSGTSMAAPHVSGAIAVLKSATPAATVDAIESALRSSGKKILDPRTNTSLTLIDVQAAVAALLPSAGVGLSGMVGGSRLRVAQNTTGGGSRVIIQTAPGTGAGSQELSRQLGADSIVSSLGPDTYRAEKKGGITPELIDRIKKLFGPGTKVYNDEPQKLSKPPGK